jgi:hypothetical protein
MFPIASSKQSELEFMLGTSLTCNDEELSIYGDFQAAAAKVIVAYFEKCDPKDRPTCKTDAEVNAWLKGKYLVFLYNR